MLHCIMRMVYRGFYLVLGVLGAFACNQSGLSGLTAAPHCDEDFVIAYNQVALEGESLEALQESYANIQCQAIDRATGTILTVQLDGSAVGSAQGIEMIPTDKNVEVIPQDFSAEEAGEV